ncbi:MAG: alkaline phosphatase [Rhodobacteraceae bacterium]|nr:alkaline phosphatase [Paracoccaceae bacterium]
MSDWRSVCTAFVAGLIGLIYPPPSLAQSENPWYKAGQSELRTHLARQPNTATARNIILFLADGNGIATNYATRIFQGQRLGGYGDEHIMAKERMPYLALAKTYTTNAQTPDSAGTAVAFLSGIKTKNGVLGVDETLRRGECDDVAGAQVNSIGDLAHVMGKSVGIISTARITHATTAALYAHAADRTFEHDGAQPKGCVVPDIAAQLLQEMVTGKLDLALGGGRRNFLPRSVTGEEGSPGKRQDGRNMIAEALDAGIQYAWDNASFARLNRDHSAPVLGLFASSHMSYEHDRRDEPSIVDMTQSAINYLSNNQKGYFLLVESGRVDHANHRNNAFRALVDGSAFDDAVARAVAMTDPGDTLIIVTADHGHTMAINGYCGRGSPILGLCMKIDPKGESHRDRPNLAADNKPYTAIGYLNGPGSIITRQADGTYFGTRPVPDQAGVTDPDYIQQSALPRGSQTHSPVDLAIYAQGPWAHLFDGTVEQNYIYHVMRHAFEAK